MREAGTTVRIPTFAEAFRFWLKLGFISFGGPSGQIAVMHAELVEKRRWISNDRFLHALNYCMLLPGPEAQQLAIYIGWLLHGVRGGVVAGALFVLPAVILLWGLSLLYVSGGHLPGVTAVFEGLKPAVVAIVAIAIVRIGRRVLTSRFSWIVAVAAFAAIFLVRVPFPLIVASAALAGFLTTKPGRPEDRKSPASSAIVHPFRAALCCIVLWWTPILFTGLIFGWQHTLFREGVFFSKAAMVTFGGAYAVLPYVSQQAVENYHWLSTGQMVDGLALAETTPGPLVIVLQFVGFLGGWNFPGDLPPLVSATAGALITSWATFLPSFLWIFLGAPYVEYLRGNARLGGVLAAVTSAVTGVILNLAVWFGIHVFLPPGRPVNVFGIVIALAAFIGMLRGKWSVLSVIAGAAGLGVLQWLVRG